MPRKRRVPPETQRQDHLIAHSVVLILHALDERYPTAGLNAAASLVEAFVESSVIDPGRPPAAPNAARTAVAAWDAAVAGAVERQS